MNIGFFIDYDNLSDISKAEGLLACVTKILDNFQSTSLGTINRVEIRIYGGWYDSSANLTLKAIDLSQEIENDFPKPLTLKKNNKFLKFICNSELAFSLIEVPGEIYFNTFRRKVVNKSMRPLSKAKLGCEIDTCLADQFHKCFSERKCIHTNCQRPLSDFIHRNEQKMVDTLIICDILHGSSIYDHCILISSDEDFVPLIRTFLNRNSNITLVETKSNSTSLSVKYNLKLNSLSL